MPITTRQLGAGDIEPVEQMLLRAFPGSAPYGPRLREFLASGAWAAVAVDGDTIAGMAVLLDYVTSGYVAHVGVEPALQGRGIGRRLMEEVLREGRARRLEYLELESTAAGFKLYTALGFLAFGETLAARGGAARTSGERAADARPRDLAGVAALDARAFGSDRSATVAQWFADRTAKISVRRERDAVVAYAASRRGRIGPWVAEHAQAAEQVLDRVLAAQSGEAVIFVPSENRAALALIAARGFVVEGHHTHMIFGREVPVARPNVYGRITLGQG